MKKLNKTKNTIESTVWGMANKIVALVFPFIIRTILIHKMGAEYAGLSSLFTSILQVLSLADLGIGSAIVFSMYKAVSENDNETLSAYLNFFRRTFFVIGIVALAIGLSFMPFLPHLITGEVPSDINLYTLYFIYLTNTVISYLFFSYRSAILSAYQREAENSKILMISNVGMFTLQIIVLQFSRNYYLYIILLPIFTLIMNFCRYLYVKKHYPNVKCEGNISAEQKKEIKTNISALFLHKIGAVTVNTIDNIIISSFLGLVLLSNYNNYYYLINAVTAIVLIFFSSLTAGVGNSLITENRGKCKRDFYTIFYLNGFVVVVSTACFFTMYQDFITIWVGEEYLFDFSMMILLCVYYYIHTIRRTIIAYRDAAGMWVDNKWQPIVSAMVNLTLNIVLIHCIGIKGVVISTIVSMVLVDIPWETGKLIKKLFNESVKKYAIRLLFYSCISVASCLILYYGGHFIFVDNIYVRLILDFISAIIVSVMLFVVGTMRMSEFSHARSLALKVLKRN